MIIGLTGCMGVGKDETCRQLQSYLGKNIIRLAFADALKDLVQRAWHIPDTHMKSKPKYVRTLLQVVGTNLFRELVDDNFWVKRLHAEVQKRFKSYLSSKRQHIVVTDVRFINEAEYIKSVGGFVVKIVGPDRRKNRTGNKNHRSETEIRRIYADHRIENTETKKDLAESILRIFKSRRLMDR